jgi:16S rRNA A1518/A1519 N6-dimethyltransferase RsmA/KsgA/DIM1 with predicted DNA glycosylase/AP lyase activity
VPEPGPAQWLAYYSRKRVIHQWTQLYLLGATDSRTVLEVGPALGLVTSLLVNAGYQVTTLDRTPRSFAYPDVPHLKKDICELRSDEIAGYDAILCC